MIEIECPHCLYPFEVADKQEGKKVICPDCEESFRVDLEEHEVTGSIKFRVGEYTIGMDDGTMIIDGPDEDKARAIGQRFLELLKSGVIQNAYENEASWTHHFDDLI